MVRYQRIEQRLVRVLQVAHEAVFLDGSSKARQPVSPARALLLQIADVRWKQTMQSERAALSLGKRCAFVEPGIAEQLRSVEFDFHSTGTRCTHVPGSSFRSVFRSVRLMHKH